MLTISQIRGLRLTAGITQKEFSELMDVPQGTWSNIEIGNMPLYSEYASKAENLFKELGVLKEGMEIPVARPEETRWARVDIPYKRTKETKVEKTEKPQKEVQFEETDWEEKKDDATRPNHYKKGGMDLFEFLQIKWTREQLEAFYAGNIMKYVLRYNDKNGVEDLKKAKVYLDELINLHQEE